MGVVIQKRLFTDQIASVIESASRDVSDGNILARVPNEKADWELAAKSFENTAMNGKTSQVFCCPDPPEII
jgi:hypothetical protein